MSESEVIWVGIDVSKRQLDVFLRPVGQVYQEPNTAFGVSRIVEELATLKPALVVLEATGGMEIAAVAGLSGAGMPVAVVNPRHVRSFARAIGRNAKTDKIDAAVLAHFAEAVKPQVRPLPDAAARELSELVARRRQVVEMLVAEKAHLAAVRGPTRSGIVSHLAWLEESLADLDAQLRACIEGSPVWCARRELLESAPGVGPVLSLTLIAHLPELGTLTGKQIASLVGVAPLNCDSGTMRAKRTVWGGRAQVRAVLYMATVAALRCNPTILAFYDRLRKKGKPGKVAVTACMRKFLVMLNAIAKTQQPWRVEGDSVPA